MLAKVLLTALAGSGVVSAQLHSLAVAAGLDFFGTTVDERYINSDAQYRAIITDTSEFGQIVPENGQKWINTGPQRGVWNYNYADIVPNLARQNGHILRCHTLIWHTSLPPWVENGDWNRQTLTEVIEAHIQNVASHFRGQCTHWDVVNEAADDDGNWRNTLFYRVLGTDYLPIAFRAARAADPVAKLYYNDYNLEYNGAKTDRTVEIVRIIQNAGAPIDGVGFQGHLVVGSVPGRAQLASTLRRFTALGVEVAYTEVDIRHASLPASPAAQAQQGNDYATVIGSCLDLGRDCVGFTLWGFTDKYSWIPEVFPNEGDALLYDRNFNKKPAWTSVSSILAAAATGMPPTTTAPPTTMTTTTTTSPPVPTQTSGGQEQTQWGQCGGVGWSGPTRCQAPFTCTRQNDWYYQCI